MITYLEFGIMRGQSMLCKSVDIAKFSFLMVGVSYLLTTTALAQSPLLAPTDDATQNIPNLEIAIDNNDGDELDIQKSEEGANPLTNNEPNILQKAEDGTENTALSQDEVAPTPLFKQEESSEEPTENNMLRAYNNFVDESDKKAFNESSEGDDATLGDKIMNQVKEDLFSQMADIEKQTSLLTLELKREKIKNEIAAMKAARQKAIDEEKAKQLERERIQIEWEKEQERKLIEEQQRLKETEIKYEKLRQERVLKAYKESMLKSNQEWVDYNARIYNQLVKEENAHNDLIAKQKEYFKSLLETTYKAKTAAKKAKEKYTTEIANLQTQIALLKSKLEAEMSASEEKKKQQLSSNPFALIDEDGAKQKIAEEYAIMEISGKGDALVAKLINKNGGTFMVKPGTILNTGHVIEEITQTYITADRSGVKDYLYFSAGGILDKEPSKPIQSVAAEPEKAKETSSTPARIPSLREGMFAE